jgi:hypothetical protein
MQHDASYRLDFFDSSVSTPICMIVPMTKPATDGVLTVFCGTSVIYQMLSFICVWLADRQILFLREW